MERATIEALVERMLVLTIKRSTALQPDVRRVDRTAVVAAGWHRLDQAVEWTEFYITERLGYVALWFAPGQNLGEAGAVLVPRTVSRPLP